MRFIPINELQEVFDKINGEGNFDRWLETAEDHLNNIRSLSSKERSNYWTKNNFWKELYAALSELSGNKCWYSEAPESSSEWEIEHYRPKAKSINESGVVIREDGYWWLSYHWENYRLAGSLVNKLRKDRFKKNNKDVLGKGNFFPLFDEKNVGQPEDLVCSCELPLLIDPINPRDVLLISFDKNGDPFPTYDSTKTLQNKKAVLSIKYYGLEHTPLKRGRKKIWKQCENLVVKTQNSIKNSKFDEHQIERELDECFLQLANLSSKTSPYSAVVRSFVKTKSKESNFEWLSDAAQILQ
jgi:hypothetical protein